MEESKEEVQDLLLQEDQEEESWDEDWEDSDTEEEEGEEERDMSKPRVGGVSSDVPWTGGSNINVKGNTEPADVLCYHPSSFKEMQRQHAELKTGLHESQRLELVDGQKTSIGLTVWITWMMMMLVQKGMDTVFKVWDEGTQEVDLLKEWGMVTMESLTNWIERLQGTLGDKFDKENLKLSAHCIRASLGPHLLSRVVSLTGPEATGPELFLTAVQQVGFMTASLVRSVCNQIQDMKLKSFPGENVIKMGGEDL